MIIAVVLSISVDANDLQQQSDILNQIINIGNNKEIEESILLHVKTHAQLNIEKDLLNKVELHFLDVGQGDSTLVIFPNGKIMLIDAGRSNYGTSIVNYLKNKNIYKIDYLVMTHPDGDHIGGMTKIIDNFDIGTIYMTDRISTTKTFESLLLKIESKGLKITTLKSNDTISEFDDFKVFLLSPINNYDDSNEMSLVIQIDYKNNSFLLMGDAGTIVEKDILNSNPNINADLIRIGHHGSSYSTSARFIEKVSPLFAIISVGKNNPYDHPRSSTLEILSKNEVKIFRTDELGNIVAISDGNVITIT